MNKNLQKTSSKELDLSFDFLIKDFHNRHFVVELGNPLRELKYSESYRNWFMEDFLYFLSKNGYLLRWDVSRVKFENIEKLKLNVEDLNDFKNFLTKSITNFKIFV